MISQSQTPSVYIQSVQSQGIETQAVTEELTSAIQSVVKTYEPYRAEHRPESYEFARWLIWNNQTSERLGVVALAGPQELSLPLLQQKVLLRTRAMDLLRHVA